MRSCVPNAAIDYLEGWKQTMTDYGLPPTHTPFVQSRGGMHPVSYFESAFGHWHGYDQFLPRCKAAFNHPDMRQILEA